MTEYIKTYSLKPPSAGTNLDFAAATVPARLAMTPTSNGTDLSDLLPPAEVGKILRKSIATLARWRCVGFGPRWVKLHRAVVYPRAEITAFVAANYRQSTKSAAAQSTA